MNTCIYYFSGTGNSLFVAKELEKRLSGSILIPVVRAIKQKEYDIKADRVGFVFPCHGTTIPIPVKKFIERMNTETPRYFFAIVTRAGSIFSGFSIFEKILGKKKKKLNSSFIFNMGFNDPKFKDYKPQTDKELKIIEEEVLEKLSDVVEIVDKDKEYTDQDYTGVPFSKNRLMNSFLGKLVPFATHTISPRVKKYFYSDSKCTGCGICEKVCLSEKIKIIDGKPVWQKKVTCYLCYSCLNYCQQQAIQIYPKIWMNSFTSENGRYSHPYADYRGIAEQKMIND